MLYEDPLVYNQIYNPFTEDIPFYQEMFRRYGGPVCELACGTGRVALPLARAGAQVIGIDLSSAMIKAARIHAESGDFAIPPEFYAGDMRDGSFRELCASVERFGLVIIPLHSLSHLLSTEDVLRCFRSIRQNLTDEGRLVFAVHNPDPLVLARDPDALFEVTLPGRRDTAAPAIQESTRYDPIRQTLHVRWWVECANTDSEPDPIDFVLRMFFPEELTLLLSTAGFAVEQRYGWYDESPLVAASGTQIVVAVPA